MRTKLFVTLVIVLALALPSLALAQDGPPPPELDGEIVVDGLNGPQGLHVADDGSLWVIDSGFGGDETVTFVDPASFSLVEATFGQTSRVLRVGDAGAEDAMIEEVAALPSIAAGQDFIGGARLAVLDGTVYATVGSWHFSLGEEVAVEGYYAGVVELTDMGYEPVADLWAFEAANNPDQSGNRESHPYGIAAGPDGLLYVADAAANALLSVNPADGAVELVATFESLPGVFPNPWRDGELVTDAVPTGVVFGEDGMIYVSFLSGAPFVPGSAKVVQVAEDGTVSDFATGLTMLTDLKMGPDGNLYAISFGMFTEEGPVPNSGAVVRILPDGTHETIIEGLPFATAIALDADGNGYVAINGIAIPNAGMVVYYEGMTGMEAMPAM